MLQQQFPKSLKGKTQKRRVTHAFHSPLPCALPSPNRSPLTHLRSQNPPKYTSFFRGGAVADEYVAAIAAVTATNAAAVAAVVVAVAFAVVLTAFEWRCDVVMQHDDQ